MPFASKAEALADMKRRAAELADQDASESSSDSGSDSDSVCSSDDDSNPQVSTESSSSSSSSTGVNSEDDVAQKLLSVLQSTDIGTDIQLFTPGVLAYMESSKKVKSSLIDNVNEYKRVGGEKDKVVEKALNLKVTQVGVLNTNLKRYITNGSYTVCAKKIGVKSKVPIVTVFGILSMMVTLYDHIHGKNVIECFKSHSTVDLVYAFQQFFVHLINIFERKTPFVDFKEEWKSHGLSHSSLVSGRKRKSTGGNDVFYYHYEWMEFFTGKSKTITNLINDIREANTVRKEMIVLEKSNVSNERRTKQLIEISGDIDIASQKSLSVDQQLRILKTKKEQIDGNVSVFEKAQKLNAKAFEFELEDSPDVTIDTIGVNPEKLLRFITTVEVEPKKRTRTRKPKI